MCSSFIYAGMNSLCFRTLVFAACLRDVILRNAVLRTHRRRTERRRSGCMFALEGSLAEFMFLLLFGGLGLSDMGDARLIGAVATDGSAGCEND
jgi:hypothetical protein